MGGYDMSQRTPARTDDDVWAELRERLDDWRRTIGATTTGDLRTREFLRVVDEYAAETRHNPSSLINLAGERLDAEWKTAGEEDGVASIVRPRLEQLAREMRTSVRGLSFVQVGRLMSQIEDESYEANAHIAFDELLVASHRVIKDAADR
jgi:hypothetical protein